MGKIGGYVGERRGRKRGLIDYGSIVCFLCVFSPLFPPWLVGVVIGIFCGHLRADRLSPASEIFQERLGFFGIIFDQIIFFKRVGFQVEEFECSFFEEFDEFPVALPDGAVGECAMVVRVVPVEGVAIE